MRINLAATTLFLAIIASTAGLTSASHAAPGPLAPAEMQQFAGALAPLALSTDDLHLDAESIGLWGGDKYKLKVLDFLRADVLRCGPYARSTSGALLLNKDNLGNLVTGAHSRLDNGIRLGLVDDPLAAQRKLVEDAGADCLAQALAGVTGQAAQSFSSDPAYASIPLAVRKAAALVLFTVPDAQRDRELGLLEPLSTLNMNSYDVVDRIQKFTVNTFAEEDDTTGHEVIDDRADALLVEGLIDRVDWNYLNRSSTLLAIATQESYKLMLPPLPVPATPLTPGVEPPVPTPAEVAAQAAADAAFLAALDIDFHFEAQTSIGTVRLCGNAMDECPPGDYLLSIDTGGSDVYGQAGGADFTHPISISIDCGGEDHYAESDEDSPSFGAGYFGTGILLDAEGDDTYSSTWIGQGSGIFGTGVLYDLAGNDRYDSGGYSQGSGTYGAGVLADLGGDDTYKTYKYGQAYGGTRGCGILLDVSGQDQYLANMEEHFNGGLYGPTHHVHFVQGSAYGRRADITDGHSWAGGCGILCDGAGDDFYEADCYGQGNAYWHSIGMLVDKGGNDTYRAGQYSQASAPHFACGILQDDGGDDKYTITIRQSMSHGRDWSIAWLEDSAGNDWYQGARTTLGCSHVNAMSVFWDKLGDDTYIMKGTGLGESEPEPNGSPRDWLLTLGLFIDGGGHDGYYLLPGDDSYEASNTYVGDVTPEQLGTLTRLDFCGDGKQWQHSLPPEAAPGYMGSGVDY